MNKQRLREALTSAMVAFLGPTGAVGCGAGAVLQSGAVAPEVIGDGPHGQAVRLSEQRGKLAVIYFYPRDETPGCTKEACAFRDAFDLYSKRGIVIFGISRDDAASHKEFRKKHELPFVLVADTGGKTQAAYGVPSRFFMAARMTFLIDAQGKVARVWKDVDPGVHAKEVLDAADKLSSMP